MFYLTYSNATINVYILITFHPKQGDRATKMQVFTGGERECGNFIEDIHNKENSILADRRW